MFTLKPKLSFDGAEHTKFDLEAVCLKPVVYKVRVVITVVYQLRLRLMFDSLAAYEKLLSFDRD